MPAKLNTRLLTLIPVAIALNMACGQIASLLKLPIFLDSIGTLLIAALGGPWIGLLTGVLTNLIWGIISSPIAAAFAPVAGVIGLIAGICARCGLLRNLWKVLLSGVLIGFGASLVAIPIRVYLFGGVTGSGADFITAYLLATGQDLVGSVMLTVLGSNLPDKIITLLIAWGILKNLPKRLQLSLATRAG